MSSILRKVSFDQVRETESGKFSEFGSAFSIISSFTRESAMEVYHSATLSDETNMGDSSKQLYDCFTAMIQQGITVNYILHFIEYMFPSYEKLGLEEINRMKRIEKHNGYPLDLSVELSLLEEFIGDKENYIFKISITRVETGFQKEVELRKAELSDEEFYRELVKFLKQFKRSVLSMKPNKYPFYCACRAGTEESMAAKDTLTQIAADSLR